MAGSSRRTRWPQNRLRPIVAESRNSETSSPVMRNPDSTKKTSTEKNPPISHENPAWKKRIRMMASARTPSRAGSRRTVVSGSRRSWLASLTVVGTGIA